MNEHIRAAKRQMKPAWNELRERRILEQVLEEAQQPPTVQPRPWGKWIGVGVAAAVVLVLGLGLGLVLTHWTKERSTAVRHTSNASYSGPKAHRAGGAMRTPRRVTAPKDATEPSVVRFAEGSSAEVSPGGEITVTHQQPSRIRLVQRSGRVRYRVTPGLKRTFEVSAAGVVLRVIGTEFTVSILPSDGVQVRVVRGVVETRDSNRRMRLRAGERVLLRGRTRSLAPAMRAAGVTQPGTETSDKQTQPFSMSPSTPPSRLKAQRKMSTAPPSSAELLRLVDRARRSGKLARAAQLLRTLLGRPGSEPRRRTARFILAQVEASRQRHQTAANEYRRYRRSSPRSPLAQDALAGEARARWSARQHRRARTLAQLYLRRYPRGAHARAMRDILP